MSVSLFYFLFIGVCPEGCVYNYFRQDYPYKGVPVVAGDDLKVTRSSETSWLIEKADWRDYTQLTQLERACFSSEDAWPFWDLIGVLTFPGLIRLKAVVEGRMVGFISGEFDRVKKKGWITTLAVLPAFRRKGIAQALLAQCEHDLGMPVVRLSVRASNSGAIKLYEIAGYKISDRWARYYAGGEDAVVFEKRC